ncbi:hypothetical protein F5887DRAFT_648260 [Amanita rubescens]|nr:hypothetical protein F5887DRAFT_648260 [Amanita rubescens]
MKPWQALTLAGCIFSTGFSDGLASIRMDATLYLHEDRSLPRSLQLKLRGLSQHVHCSWSDVSPIDIYFCGTFAKEVCAAKLKDPCGNRQYSYLEKRESAIRTCWSDHGPKVPLSS